MNSRAESAGAKRAGKARAGFYVHLTAYLVVNALLVCVNLFSTPDNLWCKWPLAGWGVGLLVHALAVFALPVLRTSPK